MEAESRSKAGQHADWRATKELLQRRAAADGDENMRIQEAGRLVGLCKLIGELCRRRVFGRNKQKVGNNIIKWASQM